MIKIQISVEHASDGSLSGFCEQYPGVITSGQDIEELKANLIEAFELYFDDGRTLHESNFELHFVNEPLT